MKNLTLALILFSSFQILNAQDSNNKFSLGINAFRYAPPSSGFYVDHWNKNVSSILNGFNLAYQQNSRIGYTAEFRKVSSYIHEFSFDSYEKLSTTGVEISLGPTFSSKEFHRFSITFSLEGFAEFTKVRGWHTIGDPTVYEESHNKNYLGILTGLELNFKITDFMSLFAKTRSRFGNVTYKVIEGSYPEEPSLWGNQNFWQYQFEPLSGLGFRV